MPSMDAILRIRARAEGKAEITELDRAMRRLGPGAESAAPGVGRLNRMLSEMGTIAGGIGLAGLGAGLLRFGGASIQAGDEAVRFEQRLKVLADRFGETGQMMDFITKASDRYSIGLLETGEAFSFLYAASREMVSGGEEVQTTFRGIMNLARQVGLPIYEAKEAMRQWTQSIGEGRLKGQEYISMMQRLPMLNKLLVRAFNELRQESGQPLITKEKADQMVAAVKDGEKRQTEEIKKGILDRKNAAERETDELLREIEKRYERQRRLIGDKNEDIDNQERKARDKQAEDEREAIERRFDEQRKAYERDFEDRRDRFLKNNENLSDEALKKFERGFEDQKEIEMRYLDQRRERELEALQERFDAEAIQRGRALRNQRQQQEDALTEQQQREETKVREALEKRRQELDFDLKRQVEANTKANEEIIAGILSRVQVTEGQLKKLAEEGKISMQVMNRVMQIAAGDTTFPAATPLDRLAKSMSDLRLEIGDNLQPLLRPLADGVDLLVRGFGAMPEALQATAIGLIAVGGAAVGVRALLGTVGQVKALTDAFRGLSGAAKAAKVAQVAGDVTTLGRTSLNPFKVKQIAPPIAAPPPGIFKGFLGELGNVSKALLGLTKQAGLFAFEFLKVIPGMGRLSGVATTAALAVRGAFASILGWLSGTFVPALTAIFTGPAANVFKGFLAQIAVVSRALISITITPAAMAIRVALTSLIAWMAGTFVPAMVAFFSGPVGWIALGVAALIAGIIFFREPIMNFLGWAFEQIGKFWEGVWSFIYDTQLKHWVDLFNNPDLLRKPLTEFGAFMSDLFKKLWSGIIDWVNKNFLKRWDTIWDGIQKSPERVKNTVSKWFSDLYKFTIDTWNNIPALLQGVWQNVTDGMSRTWRTMTSGVRNMINSVIGLWNSIARKTTGFAGLSLPIIAPIPDTPAFARGGFVSQPTMGLIGEGRNPREYVIPEGGMDAAAAGWQAGLRGNQLVAAWQSPGLAPGRATTTGAMASGPVQITITGGTVQLPDGRQAVTLDQVEAIATAITRAAAPGIVRASVQASGGVMTSAAGRARYGLS